jgi:hypothetical protein
VVLQQSSGRPSTPGANLTDKVEQFLETCDEVSDVHDLHEEFEILHTTIQLENESLDDTLKMD